MFTFFVLSDLLVNYGFINFIGFILGPFFNKILHISNNGIYIIVMSMLSGTPSSAKYIKELYNDNKINIEEAKRIILFSHFSNPLFILGTISLSILGDKKLGIIILISHYLGNLIIGLLTKNKTIYSNNKTSFDLPNKTFIQILCESINNTINTLLLILGIITVCTIISSIIEYHFNNNLITLFNMYFEMTKGINIVNELNISLVQKGLFITSIISFGGICVHMQVASILCDTKIKYVPYLLARILHSIISSIIYIIIIILIHY